VAEALVGDSHAPNVQRDVAARRITLIALLALIALPWVETDRFALHVLSLVAIASIAAMGLQILLGGSGQLSIGQAAFYGIGAYTSALLTSARRGVSARYCRRGCRRRQLADGADNPAHWPVAVATRILHHRLSGPQE
jgi:ABC-type branched-subunit amino acid transport system permease subunit